MINDGASLVDDIEGAGSGVRDGAAGVKRRKSELAPLVLLPSPHPKTFVLNLRLHSTFFLAAVYTLPPSPPSHPVAPFRAAPAPRSRRLPTPPDLKHPIPPLPWRSCYELPV